MKSGDYNNKINLKNVLNWVQEMLMPILPSNCLIVIDNAPYHAVQINKPPTLAPRKEDIQELLEMNHVGYKEAITKEEEKKKRTAENY